jgi:hypothetical protein
MNMEARSMSVKKFVKSVVWVAMGVAANISVALALDAPNGPPILKVTGSIKQFNQTGSASFDRAMLLKLKGRVATMKTPWSEGETTFAGPLLSEILKEIGASGTTLVVKALNDYSVEIPISDATDFQTILAMSKDGKMMSVRENGPLFLIYPFDKKPELYNEKYFSRSVWQIREIEVVQ